MSADKLDAFVGWGITDMDDPSRPSTIVAVERDGTSIFFVTAAGWRFGGQNAYSWIRHESADSVIVGIGQYLSARLTPPKG